MEEVEGNLLIKWSINVIGACSTELLTYLKLTDWSSYWRITCWLVLRLLMGRVIDVLSVCWWELLTCLGLTDRRRNLYFWYFFVGIEWIATKTKMNQWKWQLLLKMELNKFFLHSLHSNLSLHYLVHAKILSCS